jgi:hypothetical protein
MHYSLLTTGEKESYISSIRKNLEADLRLIVTKEI